MDTSIQKHLSYLSVSGRLKELLGDTGWLSVPLSRPYGFTSIPIQLVKIELSNMALKRSIAVTTSAGAVVTPALGDVFSSYADFTALMQAMKSANYINFTLSGPYLVDIASVNSTRFTGDFWHDAGLTDSAGNLVSTYYTRRWVGLENFDVVTRNSAVLQERHDILCSLTTNPALTVYVPQPSDHWLITNPFGGSEVALGLYSHKLQRNILSSDISDFADPFITVTLLTTISY